jgi:hypothetical protein
MAEKIYVDYDNVIHLLLKENGIVTNLTDSGDYARSISKAAVLFKGQIIDSTNFPDAFDWDTSGTSGIIEIDIAKTSGLETGTDSAAELILYDPDNLNGVVWGTFALTVTQLEGDVVEA